MQRERLCIIITLVKYGSDIVIYCVEDDNGIRDLMIYTLNASGFEAKGFSRAEDFYAALKNEMPELVMLDIMLPGEDGISILKNLRANGVTRNLPVIMASARGMEYDKVLGLDNGADDYIAKPFGMMEMVSRVKAVLRRCEKKSAESARAGNIEIDSERHKVKVNGDEITLTLKEFELLKLLCENEGVVFSREKLLAKIWGIDFMGETRTVDVHIGTLRTKLGKDGDMIETVRGVGYRLEAKE